MFCLNCNLFVQVDTIPAICRNILYYEALQKRKVLFDALVTGLQAFDLMPVLRAFSDVFQPLFVASPPSTPEDLWRIVRFEQKCEEGGDRARVKSWLKRFIADLSASGELIVRGLFQPLH